MSYILDALRRAEEERTRSARALALGLEAEPVAQARRWGPAVWLALGLTAVAMINVALAVLLLDPLGQRSTPATVDQSVGAEQPSPGEGAVAGGPGGGTETTLPARQPPQLSTQAPEGSAVGTAEGEGEARAGTPAASAGAATAQSRQGPPERVAATASDGQDRGETPGVTGTDPGAPRVASAPVRAADAGAESAAAPSSESGPPPPAAAGPASEPRNRARPVPAQSQALPSLQDLPIRTQRAVGALRMGLHVYHDDAERRFVLLNRTRLSEQDWLTNELRLDAIRRDGVVMRFRDQRFFLPRGASIAGP